MFNIWDSFMKRDNYQQENSSSFRHFWVAIDRSKQIVVGHVGVIMSTYDDDDLSIYYKPDLTSSNVCELVRMGVHEDYRGKKLGKRLCETVEKYALNHGMKQLVLSTMDRMELARRMYEACGYKLVNETKIPAEELLGPGDWEQLYVVHYIKPLDNE